MPRKGVLSGAKISNRHSTLVEGAEELVLKLKRLPEVSKIVLSVIHPASPAPRRIKTTPIAGGLCLKFRSSRSVQTLFVYTKEPGKVTAVLSMLT